jgi:hypothetical protein
MTLITTVLIGAVVFFGGLALLEWRAGRTLDDRDRLEAHRRALKCLLLGSVALAIWALVHLVVE